MATEYSIDPQTGAVSVKTDGHAVLTGPITGTVKLPDGRTVDVSQPVVVMDSHDDAKAVAIAISERYDDEGHPAVPVSDENPSGFVHDADQSAANMQEG